MYKIIIIKQNSLNSLRSYMYLKPKYLAILFYKTNRESYVRHVHRKNVYIILTLWL